MTRGVRWVMALAAVFMAAGPQNVSAEQLAGVTPLGPFQIGPFQIGPFDTIVTFNSNSATFPTSIKLVRGLGFGESLKVIDVRPATGELFGVGVSGNNAQLYTIDIETGILTEVGTPFPNLDNTVGTTFGFDFNPTIDRIRLVSTSGQNIVFNPDTGAVTQATNLFYGPGDPNEGDVPNVSNIAYDNNVGGAMTTLQRGIDIDNDVLVTVANNAGTLGTIGSLGLNASAATGFDVSGDTGIGYAMIRQSLLPFAALYTINLTTGQATIIGVPLAGMFPVNALTVLPAPPPIGAP